MYQVITISNPIGDIIFQLDESLCMDIVQHYKITCGSHCSDHRTMDGMALEFYRLITTFLKGQGTSTYYNPKGVQNGIFL